MKKFLITGVNSGLGKYLFQNLLDCDGLDRNNFEKICNVEYDNIIHCAFNKENIITDYRKYLDDNIFLTKRLKKIKHKNFIYISTVDVYQKNLSMYAHFKRFSETLLGPDDLILRCPTIIGETMKKNHLIRLRDNEMEISLSKDSEFNYILMNDIFDFFNKEDHLNYKGILDFISNDLIKLENVKDFFGSKTNLGDFTFKNTMNVINPIFKLDDKYNVSSFEKIKKYFI